MLDPRAFLINSKTGRVVAATFIEFLSGNSTNPSICFTDSPDSGLQCDNAGAVNYVKNGINLGELGTASSLIGGSDTQIQFNDSGSFGGSADLTWNDTGKELNVGGDLTAGSFIPTSSTVPTNGIYRPGADQVAISTNGTGRLFVDADGNVEVGNQRFYVDNTNGRVGILTSSPQKTLEVAASADPTLRFNDLRGYTTDLKQGGSIFSIISNYPTGPILLGTNGTERMKITSDAYVRLASGTGGIQFNGDTAAANALDDYEEGTFTPTIIGSTTAGTATYTGQTGKYTKVGNLVTCSIYLNYSGGTGTGNMRIAGLPFTVANGGSSSISFGIFSNIALAANSVATGYANELTSQVFLTQYASGGGGYAFIAYDAAGEILTSFAYYT